MLWKNRTLENFRLALNFLQLPIQVCFTATVAFCETLACVLTIAKVRLGSNKNTFKTFYILFLFEPNVSLQQILLGGHSGKQLSH